MVRKDIRIIIDRFIDRIFSFLKKLFYSFLKSQGKINLPKVNYSLALTTNDLLTQQFINANKQLK